MSFDDQIPPSPEPNALPNSSHRGPGADASEPGTSGWRHVSTTSVPNVTPVVVRVEQPAQPRGLMIALIVLLSIAILTFGGCGLLGLGAMGSIGSLMSGGSSGTTITTRPTIAVYHMSSTIGGTSGVTPEAMMQVIDTVESTPSIKALVIRCDCPGGEAAASSEIADYLAECDKPVVFSVGSMCASGAYFAASQSDWIVATSFSEVGSIGTIVTIYDASRLLDTIGIETQVIKSSAMKDMGSYSRPLTDEETALLQDEIDRMTTMFVERVADGRNVPVDTVEQWANGTTFLADDALEMGMIDEVGTFRDALDAAARLAGCPDNYTTLSIDPPSSFDSLLYSFIG